MLKPDWKIKENDDMRLDIVPDRIVMILLPYLVGDFSLSSIALSLVSTLADNIHNPVSISY